MINESQKIIHLAYYAALKDHAGCSDESIQTSAQTAQDLYREVQSKHGFALNTDQLKVSVNDMFVDWETQLKSEDRVVFIPPVAGG